MKHTARYANSAPLISIITPTYNHERYIAECIKSVMGQSYQNWEMFIVNDGSTDSTGEIIQSYAKKDSRILAFHQKHKGINRLVETYNFALEKSQGNLVAILEGDDYWPRNKLQVQTDWHQKHPNILLSYGTYINVHPNKTLPGEKPFKYGQVSGSEWFKLQALRQSGIIAASVVIKRDALRRIGGFVTWDGFPAVDSPTYFAIAKLSKATFYVGQDVTAYWRHHANQVTGSRGVDLAETNTQKVLEFYRSLSDSDKKLLKITEAEVLKARHAGLADAYLGATRAALIQRNRHEALRLASHLWAYGGSKRKLQAVAARVAALTGFDLELLFKSYEVLIGEGTR